MRSQTNIWSTLLLALRGLSGWYFSSFMTWDLRLILSLSASFESNIKGLKSIYSIKENNVQYVGGMINVLCGMWYFRAIEGDFKPFSASW